MPFLLDYECGNGHRFEYMADSRDTAPRYAKCEHCCAGTSTEDDVDNYNLLVPDNKHPTLPFGVAERIISGTAAPVTIRQGNGDFAERERERLGKRSREHDAQKGTIDESRHNAEVQLTKLGVPLQTIRDKKLWGV